MSTQIQAKNEFPYGLLRAGFPYLKTIGMRRILNSPIDVAIESEDRIYVLVRGGAATFIRVWFFEDADRLPDSFEDIGSYGKEGGQFQWPVSLILDLDKNLVVSDESLNRITTFSRQGEYLHSWGTSGNKPGELDGPSGIAFNPDGNLLVSDTKNHRIQEFTPEGTFIKDWGGFGHSNGDLNMPWGLATDRFGDVYVSDWGNNRICRFDSQGNFIACFGSEGSGNGYLRGPSGIAVDAFGDIYVADTGNNRIQLFNQEGSYVQEFLGDATLAKCAKDYMLTNAGSNRLRDMSDLSVQKKLRDPRSVRLDEKGRMYIPDHLSFRVQIYQNESIPLDKTQYGPPRTSPTLLQE